MQEYSQELAVLGFVLFLAMCAYVFLRPSRPRELPPTFEMEISAGSIRVLSGSPPSAFIHSCADIATRYGVETGRITEQPIGDSARLVLSPDIPEQYHQAFRNAWTPPTWSDDGPNRRA